MTDVSFIKDGSNKNHAPACIHRGPFAVPNEEDRLGYSVKNRVIGEGEKGAEDETLLVQWGAVLSRALVACQ